MLNQPDRDSVGTEKEEERAGVGGRQILFENSRTLKKEVNCIKQE